MDVSSKSSTESRQLFIHKKHFLSPKRNVMFVETKILKPFQIHIPVTIGDVIQELKSRLQMEPRYLLPCSSSAWIWSLARGYWWLGPSKITRWGQIRHSVRWIFLLRSSNKISHSHSHSHAVILHKIFYSTNIFLCFYFIQNKMCQTRHFAALFARHQIIFSFAKKYKPQVKHANKQKTL